MGGARPRTGASAAIPGGPVALDSQFPKLGLCKLRTSESEFLGNPLMDLEIPPLKVKNLLESNPLKYTFFVRGLTAGDQEHCLERTV